MPVVRPLLSLLLFLSWMQAFAQVNVDPAHERKSLQVEGIVISGENAASPTWPFDFLLDEAHSLRQNYPRRMNFNQLARIGDALTQSLRARGYKFHYVYLPAQDARDGLVRFNVVEISLDGVSVLGDALASGQLTGAFADLVGQPLYQPNIDDRLRALKAQPGQSLFAYYSRGSRANSVRLNLRSTPDQQLFLNGSLDNFGAESSGEYRASAGLSWLSPLDSFDRLDLGFMAAAGETRNLYGYLSYQHPLFSHTSALTWQLANNQYEVGGDFTLLELQGDALIGGLEFSQQFYPTDRQRHSLLLSAQQKALSYQNVFDDPTLVDDEDAQVLTLGYRWQYSGNYLRQSLELNARRADHQLTGSQQYQQDVHAGFLQSDSRWQLDQHQLQLRLQYQYADRLLPSFEKLSLTGAGGVRGFYAGQFAVDTGAKLGLQWRWQVWRGDSLSLETQLFFDAATGEKLGPDGQQLDRGELMSAGLGLTAGLGRHLSVRLQASAWTDATLDNSIAPNEQPWLLDLHYQW